MNMVPLPSKTPFGNLLAAKMSIDQRIDYINFKLDSVYKPFPIQVQDGIFSPLFAQLIDTPIEEVVYLVRRAADDLVCLWSILKDFSNNGTYSSKIKADCIWALGQDIAEVGATHEFQPDLNWLVAFNDVTNAYKHSFAQRQLQILSAREPMVLAIVWKKNDTKNASDFKQLTLRAVIEGFDAFHQRTEIWFRAWSKANPDNHQSKKYNL